MTILIAQATPELSKSFLEQLPEILKSVASNPLGYGALILIIVAVLAGFLFGKANQKVKLAAFGLVIVCVLVFCIFVVYTYLRLNPPPTPPGGGTNSSPVLVMTNQVVPPTLPNCKVAGTVYNEDQQPAAGLQNVKLAYLPTGVPNPQPVQVATTDPAGRFSFNCSQINPEAFPIRLRASYKGLAVESDDSLFFGENPQVSIYVSPATLANHYQTNTQVLRVSSAKLFRANHPILTNTVQPISAPAHSFMTVPNNIRIVK